ncbi:TPA: hypothetical protein HA235_01720 [Candidatus Woesearchaeota archaeon]|nr:hypothetical protein [Candidatus Woesearchaeota archaeon]HIH31402.1 hypothetical protein [Candidatus Woesearchaeota archaeon]HIH55167.1 hypothetical protein [Candidatus Woesearchaeota archaeon]HIJ01085.1 hypothetical protein [Candidatus Woesearchaeota archaeon]HIJ14113.1 hypothetical protein [Candidatus Woesearchaeota archaeon]
MNIKYFNTNDKDVSEKKFNIFIGISLGTIKPINYDKVKEYIEWSLKYSRDSIIILVADKIAKYNYKIFSRYSTGKAENRALKEGDKYIKFFRNIIKDYPKKIKVLRWDEIWNSQKEEMKDVLGQEYKENPVFKNKVNSFIINYSNHVSKKLSDKEIEYLSQYILYELCTLLDGITHDQTHYNLLLYPTFKTNGMSQTATNIINGREFPELRNKLKLNNNMTFAEIYL